MRKIKRILLGIVCIALTSLSFLQSNTKSGLDLDIERLLNVSQAQAESGSDCSSWGYRQWNSGCLNGDGVDCWCNDREKVCTECN
ncbi:MAG: hypothetical protein K0B11_14715 [Mariniphaga sp.]|nr:hypothetical protein [Mariniphaga sp.]